MKADELRAWRMRLPRWVLIMALENQDMLIAVLREDIRELEAKLQKATNDRDRGGSTMGG